MDLRTPSVNVWSCSGALAGAPPGFVGAVAIELLALVLPAPVIRLALFLGGFVVGLGIVLLIGHRPISIGRCGASCPGRRLTPETLEYHADALARIDRRH